MFEIKLLKLEEEIKFKVAFIMGWTNIAFFSKLWSVLEIYKLMWRKEVSELEDFLRTWRNIGSMPLANFLCRTLIAIHFNCVRWGELQHFWKLRKVLDIQDEQLWKRIKLLHIQRLITAWALCCNPPSPHPSTLLPLSHKMEMPKKNILDTAAAITTRKHNLQLTILSITNLSVTSTLTIS